MTNRSAIYMREYRKKKKNTETSSDTKSNDKQKRNSYMREYRKKRTETSSGTKSSEKQKRNSYMREYRKAIINHCPSPNDSTSTFHDVVSRGPLYICSCCDQLWYKHSVSPAAELRESNPNVGKYLLNRISVNSVEWLCRTCHSYLVKNRVPPCSAVNGMQFASKPQFFDLNELECRLLAPRLAFQIDVSNTVSVLPRLPHQSGTIKVNLKRKLQYKSW